MPDLNENRPGYKPTKVGWVPKDWKTAELSELLKEKVTYGIVKPGEYDSSGNFMIRSQDYVNGWNSLETIYKVTEKLDQSYARSRVNSGDILITLVGANIGILAQVPEELDSANISRAVGRVKVDPRKVKRKFIFYYLDGGEVDRLIYRSAIGGAQPVLNLKQLGKLTIPLPPLPEQEKIAEILRTWDETLDTLDKLITAKEKRKLGLMQLLLTGKVRFPEFVPPGGTRYKSTKLGEVPEDWEVVKMKDLFIRITRKNEVLDDTVVTISAKRGFLLQESFFNKRVASKDLSGYFLLYNGEFAYNKSYSNGYPKGVIKRLDEFTQAVVTTLYICFRLTNKINIDSDYYLHLFESGILNRGLTAIAHEGGRAHGLLNVTPTDFFNLEILYPHFKEQQRISNILTTTNNEITALLSQYDALQRQKKGLMQQLLTGYVRVKQ